ncbi:MAG TPA: diguanylate cyclase, partial [Thermoanaerobaculia bacterium]
DRAGAVMHVERIRARLRETRLEVGDDVRLTVSAGVAEFPADGRIAMSLILSADRRLLAAKRAGRDRVIAEG